MNEQEEYFSPSHERLLSIAIWAKYLAWVVLIVYIVNAVLQMFQYKVFISSIELQPNFWQFLRASPFETFKLGMNMLNTALRGVVSYLVLKGISLGLNMIVETDINYRERKQEGIQ
jgi:hypothetical protein